MPTPECPVRVHGKPSPIDLPNKLCFFPLPQLGKLLDTINELRSCNTPGCRGILAPISVKSKGLGGGVSVTICCTGCAKQGGMFETNINVPGHTNAVSMCVQVAHRRWVYSCSLPQSSEKCIGDRCLCEPVFMDTIYCMYPIVKSVLNEIVRWPTRNERQKDDELRSWKRAVTVADGTLHVVGILRIRSPSELPDDSPLLPSSARRQGQSHRGRLV